MKNIITAIIFALALIWLTACGGDTTPISSSAAVEIVPESNPLSDDASSVQVGKASYENFCLSCHGPGGKGDGPAAASLSPHPSNLAELQQTVDDGYLFERIAKGKEGTAMVAWKSVLNDEQIWQVVAYIRTLK